MIIVNNEGAEHQAGFSLTGEPSAYTHSSGAVPMVASTGDLWARTWSSHTSVYRSNPWLYAVGQLLSRTSARLPFKVYKKNRQTREKELVYKGMNGRAELLARALEYPGGGVSRNALRFATMTDEIVHGNALWKIIDSGDSVVGFRRIPWAYVTVQEHDG